MAVLSDIIWLLRHPITGLISLTFLMGSCCALPNDLWGSSMIGNCISSFYSPGRYNPRGPVFYELTPLQDGHWHAASGRLDPPSGSPAPPDSPATVQVTHNLRFHRSGVWHPLRMDTIETFEIEPLDGSTTLTAEQRAAIVQAVINLGVIFPPQPPAFYLAGGGTTSRTLWGGFVGDFFVLLALLSVALSSFSLLDAWHEFRRPPPGLCPTCRYPLPTAGPTRCPECGTDTPTPPTPPQQSA